MLFDSIKIFELCSKMPRDGCAPKRAAGKKQVVLIGGAGATTLSHDDKVQLLAALQKQQQTTQELTDAEYKRTESYKVARSQRRTGGGVSGGASEGGTWLGGLPSYELGAIVAAALVTGFVIYRICACDFTGRKGAPSVGSGSPPSAQ